MTEGSEDKWISKGEKSTNSFPRNKLESFETYVVGRNGIYNFVKYGKLIINLYSKAFILFFSPSNESSLWDTNLLFAL